MQRGWNHGVFVPMMLLFPAADVPVVQVSLTSDQAVRPPFALRARILSAISEYLGPSGRGAGGFGAFDSELLPAEVPPFALRARILSAIPEYLGPSVRGGFGVFDPELLESALDAATAAPVSPCNSWAL